MEATEQQRMLGDSLLRFTQREYGFEQRRRALREGGFDPARWQSLCELGLPALLVPREHGGLQAPLADALHALECLGPALVLEPVLGSCVLATRLLARAGGPASAQWLARLAEGAVAAVALFEPGTGFDHGAPGCSARAEAGGWVLDGAKSLVLQGEHAQLLLIWARCEDGSPGWFAVPATAPGLELRAYGLLDGQRAADVRLRGVRVEAAARLHGDARQLAEELRDLWLAAICSDAVGVMQAGLDATVAHLNTRVQFGRPLAAQQVLRHAAAGMWMELEQARSMAWLAARQLETAAPAQRARLLAAVKSRVGRACREVSQGTVQLHGGIGLSDELPLSHGFKRLSLAELWLGDSRQQLMRYLGTQTGEPA